MNIWGFILFLLLVWLANTIIIAFVDSIDKDTETVALYCACGVWAFVILVINKICDIIYRAYRDRHYKAALLDPMDKICYTESEKADEYIKEHGYKWANYIKDKYTLEDGFCKRDSVCNIPNIRYTPIKIIKTEHAYKLK